LFTLGSLFKITEVAQISVNLFFQRKKICINFDIKWNGLCTGVDVMITIFGEKIGVFLKKQCFDQNFAQFSFVLSQKRNFFRRIIRQKYFKNQNIGPWLCNFLRNSSGHPAFDSPEDGLAQSRADDERRNEEKGGCRHLGNVRREHFSNFPRAKKGLTGLGRPQETFFPATIWRPRHRSNGSNNDGRVLTRICVPTTSD
jgi:hypothetical protein